MSIRVVLSIKLWLIVMSTNLEYRDREKEKVGDRPAKLNEKSENDRELEQEIKNKGYIFCSKNNMKIL